MVQCLKTLGCTALACQLASHSEVKLELDMQENIRRKLLKYTELVSQQSQHMGLERGQRSLKSAHMKPVYSCASYRHTHVSFGRAGGRQGGSSTAVRCGASPPSQRGTEGGVRRAPQMNISPSPPCPAFPAGRKLSRTTLICLSHGEGTGSSPRLSPCSCPTPPPAPPPG